MYALHFWNALLGNSFSKQGRTVLCQATSSKSNINQLIILNFPEIYESFFREKSSFYLFVLIQKHKYFNHYIIKLNLKPFPSLATTFIKSQKPSPKPQSNQRKPPKWQIRTKDPRASSAQCKATQMKFQFFWLKVAISNQALSLFCSPWCSQEEASATPSFASAQVQSTVKRKEKKGKKKPNKFLKF